MGSNTGHRHQNHHFQNHRHNHQNDDDHQLHDGLQGEGGGLHRQEVQQVLVLERGDQVFICIHMYIDICLCIGILFVVHNYRC